MVIFDVQYGYGSGGSYGGGGLGSLLNYLSSYGLLDTLLPFLLIFVIVFAILEKTRVLGENKKNLNVVVALVVGLTTIAAHVTNGFGYYGYGGTFWLDPVVVINNALPQLSIVLVALIFLLILIGVFGQDYVFLGVSAPGWVTFFSIVAIIFIFGSASGLWSGFGDYFISSSPGVYLFVTLVVFGILIAWITSDSKDGKSGSDLSKLFGKK